MPASLAAELVQSMLDQIPEDDHAGVISVKHDAPTTSPTNGQAPVTSLPRYDPGTPYILEFSTILATRDAASIERMGKVVFDTVQQVLREPGRWHPITLSRASFYAPYMLKIGYVSQISFFGPDLHLPSTQGPRCADCWYRTTTLRMCRSCCIPSQACRKTSLSRRRTPYSRGWPPVLRSQVP